MTDAGHGQIEFVSDWDTPSAAGEFAMLRRLVERSGRPCVFSLNQRHGERSEMWRELLTLSDQAAADGLRMRPVTAPRPIGSLFGLSGTQNPFAGTPTYRELSALPLDERVARMRDPEVRRRILSEDPFKLSTFPLFERMGFEAMYEHMFPLGDPPNYEPPREASIASVARRRGVPAAEVAYDLLLEDEGRGFLFATFTGFNEFVCEPTREMLEHPNAMIGLGDGGAHVGFITDAGFPTYLLTHWGARPGERAAAGRGAGAALFERSGTDRRPRRPRADSSGNEGRFERDRLREPPPRQAIHRRRPAGGRQAVAAEGSRLSGDGAFGDRDLSRRRSNRGTAGSAGSRAAEGCIRNQRSADLNGRQPYSTTRWRAVGHTPICKTIMRCFPGCGRRIRCIGPSRTAIGLSGP